MIQFPWTFLQMCFMIIHTFCKKMYKKLRFYNLKPYTCQYFLKFLNN